VSQGRADAGPDAPLLAGETADAALAGTVHIIQPSKGYRFALDSVILARFAAERPAERALDLGSGCGVVALCLLALGGAQQVVGVEIQAEMVDRARRSAAWNQLQDRVQFLHGDLRSIEGLVQPRGFDTVVSNPPYRPIHSGRVSPDASTALSRHEVSSGLAEIVVAAAFALAPQGEFCAVYPAARLTSLLERTRACNLEPKVLRLMHPRQGEPASLALLRCVRGAREGLEVRSPLYLHAPGARYSAEAELLLGPPGRA